MTIKTIALTLAGIAATVATYVISASQEKERDENNKAELKAYIDQQLAEKNEVIVADESQD